MNYELKHLSFLTHRVEKGDKLSNEDFIFLTEIRGILRTANKELEKIDDAMEQMMKNC